MDGGHNLDDLVVSRCDWTERCGHPAENPVWALVDGAPTARTVCALHVAVALATGFRRGPTPAGAPQ